VWPENGTQWCESAEGESTLQHLDRNYETHQLLLAKENYAQYMTAVPGEDHRITESQNGRGWKGPLWVV